VNRRRYRPGQDEAHAVIVERVKAAGRVSTLTAAELVDTVAERYTAIVLPTRYGKSDVIRCTAIEMYRREYVSASLVLNPNRLLRDQLVDSVRMNATLQRYLIEGAASLKYRALEGKPADLHSPTANEEFLVSATIQLSVEQLPYYEQWVEHMLYRHHAPVLVYIDEAHTGSERNHWGHAVERLVRHGACACLLTATPMRSDGARIPGFDFDVITENPIKQYKVRDGESPNRIIVDVYGGTSQTLKLRAHHTTTFKQAWAEEPRPLCRISRLPFDVELKDVTDVEQAVCLSELPPTGVRQHLGKITRSAVVVRAGVERMVQQLRALRGLQPDIAAIVFVGNDEDPAKRVNEHAQLVRSAIESIDPSFEIVIATSSDGNDGTEKIQRFARGRGDVLIVKQMASLGLDVPRLKVGLDLSPIRTPAAYIQRVMRIATPYTPAEVCVLIVPDDCLNRALFDTLISDEGGEARADQLELLMSYPKDREDQAQRTLFTVDGIAESDFDDSQGVHAAAALRPDVDQIVSAIPELLSIVTHAQIAQRLVKSGLIVGHRPETSVNTGSVADDLRADINEDAKDEAKRRLKAIMGDGYDGAVYQMLIRTVYTEAKAAAGARPGCTLEEIADLEVLKRIKVALVRMRGSSPEL
jgi:hypothetical protein